MSRQTTATDEGIHSRLTNLYGKMLLHPSYRFFLLLVGAPVTIIIYFIYLYRKSKSSYNAIASEMRQKLLNEGYMDVLRKEAQDQIERKQRFFGQKASKEQTEKEAEKLAIARFTNLLDTRLKEKETELAATKVTFVDSYASFIGHPLLFVLSIIIGFPMYLLMAIYSNAYVKYIFERLMMTVFVIFGVAILVFTILYLSPMNPAANLLGETATNEQIANFNQIYGLDQPYLMQLWNNIKGILTFDLGKSFAGNEQVTTAILNKFPVTFTLTLLATIFAVIIALPIGIVSATRPNSFFDYTFMFIALIGLSIPNFWQGLIMILGFSIKLPWLPATYNPNNWMSAIMPIFVLGTALTAAVSRMTRSSTLEVINEDYIITAKAKGLSRRTVLWRHTVRNALIPIVTIIGLQFGGMLGGAAVTEQVFNISGIGNYIVEKQFIPDIPAVMGGVVYTAITISLINMFIDLLYAFFDPRIRSKLKQY
ncbi:ABC transporter permease [Paenibacillus yanchengensis]|uniref:ABC transporter permease n=1 Tax=Paenibacillus yanchengensis TaxID=2035833 RepID=A0ABW4YFN9_9BACL